MPQSGVGSMQGSSKGYTRGGTHSQCYQLNGHTEGGTHPQCNPTNGHTYFHRGGGRTHNVTQRTDTQIFLDTLTKLSDKGI